MPDSSRILGGVVQAAGGGARSGVVQAAEFWYPGRSFDESTGVVRLRYALDDLRTFEEVVEFPMPERPLDARRREVFARVLDLLYLAAGTSYYKVAAPRRVRADGVALADGAQPFIRDLYTKGLAEFAYRNDLPHVLELVPVFGPAPAGPTGGTGGPASASPDGGPALVGPPGDAAAVGGDLQAPQVSVGGGKDSVVSVEALRAAGFAPSLFAVNPNWVIEGVSATSGLPSRYARRRIDPQLFELNQAGAYNGHIPVTAINSLIAVGTSVLHGLGPVVMSNERSASSPNTVWGGHEINHQWSKSEAAEAGLSTALAAHAGLAGAYFSLLRPFSELHIASMFAPTSRYDHVLTSCNRAYRLRGAAERWCGDCPKCRFVFLALAPFMERARLVGIFGTDMLADPAQLPGYLELVGVSGHKPFECVGEVEESLVAVRLISERGGYSDSPVLAGIAGAVPSGGWPTDEQVRRVFTPQGRGGVPAAYQEVLDALGRAGRPEPGRPGHTAGGHG